MFSHFLKVAWRSLRRQLSYTLLNVTGLTLGMMVAIVVCLWIVDELSYNRHHKNYSRIAQLMVRGVNSSGAYTQWAASAPYAPEIRRLYGDDFDHMLTFSQASSPILASSTTSVIKTGYYAETGAADMLTLDMIEGVRNGLDQPNTIFLSASVAQALFGRESAMGKTVRINNREDVVVKGVFNDIPSNDDFADMTFLAPWELFVTMNRQWMRLDDWRQNGYLVFAQIREGREFVTVSQKIKDLKLKHSDEAEAKNHPQFFLHPMSKWRLYSDFPDDGSETGRIKVVWMFGTIGVFVLILACINFMNLATANSERRAKEVGIRKVAGSGRGQLVVQFFGESLIMAIISLSLALLAVIMFLPFFNSIAGKLMSLPVTEPAFMIACAVFTLFTGVFAGSYPALYLSSFRPGKVLKGALTTGGNGLLRRALVVVQFAVSITLIIGVTVVFRQIETGKHQSMGYDPNGLLWVKTRTAAIHEHIDAVRQELIATGKVSHVAEALNPVTEINSVVGGFDWTGNGPNNDLGFRCVWSSPENGKALGWHITQGRDFSRAYPGDTAAMILNESAVAAMELKDPVGTIIRMNIYDTSKPFIVVGVVKDLVMESPYSPPRKTIYMVDNTADNVVNIRMTPGTTAADGVAAIEKIFTRYEPASPFVYEFADTAFARKFSEEVQTGKLAATFAVLAIIISMLGILGLAAFVAGRRAKEIAVRKVLGASVAGIWSMLSNDFAKLVLIACVIAVPSSWYYMSNWLNQFELKTDLSWTIFATAILVTAVITLITVSYQTIKAALANPVNALRSE